MDSLIFQKVKLETGKIYFLTSLTNRFDLVNGLFKKEFERRFGGEFEPIFIYQNYPAKKYEKENFLVVNQKVAESGRDDMIIGEEYEDLNIELSKSEKFKDLVEKICEKQSVLFVLGFTSAFLNIDNKKIQYIGPSSGVATFYDNKMNQFNLFEQLGLNCTNHRFYESIEEVKKNEKLPFYVSSMYSSGGLESGEINSWEELSCFVREWRSYSNNGIIVTDIIENVDYFPNSTAIVCKDEVVNLALSDQILKGKAYVGNIFPSAMPENIQHKILKITSEVGERLRRTGYRGMFGCDFMVRRDEVFVHDLNPRHQGGYLLQHLLVGGSLLAAAEIAATLNEKIFLEDFKFNLDFFVAHKKVKLPQDKIYRVIEEIVLGEESLPIEKVGGTFISSFYPVGNFIDDAYPGYIIESGTTREDLLEGILKHSEEYGDQTVACLLEEDLSPV